MIGCNYKINPLHAGLHLTYLFNCHGNNDSFSVVTIAQNDNSGSRNDSGAGCGTVGGPTLSEKPRTS